MANILNTEIGSIRLIAERYGEEATELLIVHALTDLAAYFNFKIPFTPRQIKQTAELIFSEFQHFTPEDFKRCFNNIKLLKYGELYQSLDGGKIISMMRQYDSDFTAEEIEYRRSEAEKRRNEKIEWQPEVVEALKKTTDKIIVNKIVDKKNKTIVESLQESDNFTKQFLREFDELYLQVGESIAGVKFVRYNESKYDRMSYLKQRSYETFTND